MGSIKYRFKLSDEQMKFLKKIDFSEIKESINIRSNDITVNQDQYKIFTAILMEYEGMYGFNDNYEPNEYGRYIEAILDDLTRQRFAVTKD